VESCPGSADAQVSVGDACRLSRETEKARACYRDALTLAPGQPDARGHAGVGQVGAVGGPLVHSIGTDLYMGGSVTLKRTSYCHFTPSLSCGPSVCAVPSRSELVNVVAVNACIPDIPWRPGDNARW
jgi:hypothetical protein